MTSTRRSNRATFSPRNAVDESLEEEEAPREEIVPGVARALSPMVRRILATNPGPRTGLGTNTYMVGIDEIAVIDPGPLDKAHLDAITGCGGDLIRWIIVTNDDPHHAEAVSELKARTGAVVMAMCDVPRDEELKHGQQIVGTEFRLTIKHLPGPSADNIGLMLEEERTLLSGDLIVEGGTMAIVPPSGDMSDYITSLESLKKLRLKRIAPAHGYLIENPKEVIEEYLSHRANREKEVLKAVKGGATRVEDVVTVIYGDELEIELRELAEGTVHAHLIKLKGERKVKGTKNWAVA